LSAFPAVQRRVLRARGVSTLEQAEALLGRVPIDHDPYLMLGMQEAAQRLLRAASAGEHVVVHGDYDADGISATALLVDALQRIGIHASHFIPNRFIEGYGLSDESLAALEAHGGSVLVTVDCGIRSVAEVSKARGLGLDVIVTDHHQPGPALPEAIAVVNPRRPGDPYPFKALSGAGVAYKLACAVYRALGRTDPADLLELVAVGTVADLVDLVDENRSLVTLGLSQLRGTQRPGLRELMTAAKIDRTRLTATTIGFVLAPRLNAVGRMGSADAAYRLLMARDDADARAWAAGLETTNRLRQELTAEVVEQARVQVGDGSRDRAVLFAGDEGFGEGVIGLAAARLVDEFYRPAIVAQVGAETTRGSARSIPGFHITDALDECADLLTRHGGHAAAAGFSLRTQDLAAFLDRLQHVAAIRLADMDLTPSLDVDAELRFEEIDEELMTFIEALEPCGYGNPRPLFVAESVSVRDRRAVGRDGAHLKLLLWGTKRGFDAIAFRQAEKLALAEGRIDVAFHLERNWYQGVASLQLNVQDIRPAQG
jgi:single-stranded-DNA-specific exonuclease